MGLSTSRPTGSESRSGPAGYTRSSPIRSTPPAHSALASPSVTSAGSKYTGSHRFPSNSSHDRLDSRCCCRARRTGTAPGPGSRIGSAPNATASRKALYPSTTTATAPSMLSCSRPPNGAQARQITRAPIVVATG
ncbi:hypothetical protein [Nocardia terpenica]|uniref:hypothetical protein n=1 Tax=Nocardia terpenica TaxID=455432 RepID=UPI0031840788